MSREFVAALPEHLRSIYDKPAEPDPMQTYFKTLHQQEDMKKTTRKNSVLYRLFGENLFGFMTIDGELNLNIPIIDVNELTRAMVDEEAILSLMSDVTGTVGDGRIRNTINVNRVPKGELPHPEKEDVTFFYDASERVKQLDEARKVIKEALKDINELFGWYVDEEIFGHRVAGDLHAAIYPPISPVYATKDQYNAATAARRMLAALHRPGNPINHSSNAACHMYFRLTIKMLDLPRAIRNIRW